MSSLRQLLLPATASLLVAVSDAVVINEIHFNPSDNTVRQEFIELFNPGDSEADLSGWRLSGAVTYAFPEDTRIPAGGFLLIAEHPQTIQSSYSKTALGPYDGKLDSDGETVRLRDENDGVVDFADYKVGFPWPVEANGNGPSIELINPAFDNALGSSWRSSRLARPTPGVRNSVFAANTSPAIRKVKHDPQQPTDADPVIITALVTDPNGVAAVTLDYQVVAPGAYIPSHLPHSVPNIPVSQPLRPNPQYESGWTSVPMLDDGIGDDAVADDGFYTVTLPPHPHRTLLRYRITVEDGAGASDRVPYPDDPSLNFACFVYNGVPDYFGNPASTLQLVPVYHLITRGIDYAECFAYNGGDQIPQGGDARFFYNWKGALVYEGVVYDNIRYRLRGANGRYHQRGKRSMRFRLNDGHYFQARDQVGKKYPHKWRTLTTGKGFDNRSTLTYGLNEAVSMYLFNKVGVPASHTHWIHWRVIDDVMESPDRWRGDFQGLNFVLETYDVRFLETHDLEKGNLYKLINQTTDWRRQQRYQAPFGARNGRDINNIEGQLDGGDTSAYITEHVNMDKWNHWHAMVEAIRHYDFWPSANKNMVYYFEPVYTSRNRANGKLWILPWDTDASWGPTWNQGHDVVYNALFPASGGGSDGSSTPELWPDYFNAVRELRDLLWQRDQVLPLLGEFAAFIRPLERADGVRWKSAPSDAGNYGGLTGAGTSSISNLVRDMNNFAFVGGNWPGGSVPPGGRASHLDSLQGSSGESGQLPTTPTITYTGTPDFPTNGLAFESSAFADRQGNHTFGAMEWRIARVTDANAPRHDPEARFKLEWEADWESGELGTFGPTLDVPTTAVRSGFAYRARVRHKDNSGRWSHWSAPVQFTTTLPDISGYLAGLVISEVMYHPTDPTAGEFDAGFTNDDMFEWIELRNVGPVPLDLAEIRFTKGIDFDFLGAEITSLNPGQIVLVVANRGAFEMRYGTGFPIAGEWDATDRLDNGGEQVKLSFGAGDALIDFIYDDVAPWPAEPDGSGVSLVLTDPDSVPDPGVAANWQAGTVPQGTPGSAETRNKFELWMAAHGATDPLAPFANTTLPNLVAYGVGADLTLHPSHAFPVFTSVSDGPSTFPGLEFRKRGDDGDLIFIVEVSEDLLSWQSGPGFITEIGVPSDNPDDTTKAIGYSSQSLQDAPIQYLRLRVELGSPD